MKGYKEKQTCCGCNACIDVCPRKAIKMVQDREGFFYPEIERSICTGCGKCHQVCPLKAKKINEGQNLYLGVQAKDNELRYSSSSGGIFTILAQYVIKKQGVVYGAGYDHNMRVVHKEVSELSQIEVIRRTKYVQSDMDGIYQNIEKNLQSDKWVLFCGTPCQAKALLLFLQKEYEKLIVIDLVCYGVPSPGIWMDYVRYLEKRHNGKMSSFSFRDKRNIDNGHMRSYIINGKEYVGSLFNDFFCKMYFRNNIIRPSCHSCKFCTVDRCSDFTIGDFWGIEKIRPEIDDGMGTSMVIAHTGKAKRIWEEIKEETFWFECGEKNILQPRLCFPTDAAAGRWRFMLLYRCLSFSALIKLMNK